MAFDLPTDLTPELVPFAWLIGTWEGAGRLGEGEAEDGYFWQQVTFRDVGGPYLEYRSESWLTEADGTKLRILAVENGFWSLDRQQQDADAGPGMTPGDIFPVLRSADDVQKLHYGLIDGPRIQLATEGLLRSKNAKPYASSTRIYGLVNGELFWRWDVSQGNLDLQAHASAALKRVAAEDSVN